MSWDEVILGTVLEAEMEPIQQFKGCSPGRLAGSSGRMQATANNPPVIVLSMVVKNVHVDTHHFFRH